MAMDYRERRTVAKNRPKKQPISTVVVAFALVIIAAYGLGVATGWLFFRLSPKPVTVAKPTNVQLPAPATQGAAPNPAQPGTGQPGPPTQTPPLTFYDTLPRGEKAVMGSGLNPKAATPPPKESHDQAVPPVKPPPPTSAPVPAPVQPVKPEAAPKPQAAAKPATQEKKSGYAVQVASTKDKADAEAIKGRMGSRGKDAYIIVSQVKDKGTWYRVRVGHKLEPAQARELAAKFGNGAVIVAE